MMQGLHSILGIFLLTISYKALGQSSPLVPCFEPPVQSNFTLERLLGRWYELYTTSGRPRYRCYTTDFSASNRTLRGNGTQQSYDGSWRKESNIVGQFSEEDPAKISYSINRGPSFDFQELFVQWYVLETDYDNYALFWRCVATNTTEENQENVWIFGRRPRLSRENITYIAGRLELYGIENLKYYISPQYQYCTYPSCI